jgi:hypothetical protein
MSQSTSSGAGDCVAALRFTEQVRCVGGATMSEPPIGTIAPGRFYCLRSSAIIALI